MLLETLDNHLNDAFSGCGIYLSTHSAHNHLDETAQHELNLHDFGVALIWVFNSHTQLFEDHR